MIDVDCHNGRIFFSGLPTVPIHAPHKWPVLTQDMGNHNNTPSRLFVDTSHVGHYLSEVKPLYSLKPNLPANKNYFSFFPFFVLSYVEVMYQQARIWVFIALFGNLSFCQSFHSWLRKIQLLVEKFLEAPDLPKHNKFWEIQKWLTKTFGFMGVAAILLGWSI